MATQWWRESWRKLYTKLDARWLGLSLSARGLGDELIKYADDSGRLFETSGADAAGEEIARRLSARPREYKRVAEDTRELLKGSYLAIVDGWLVIQDFAEGSQEKLSPEARRKRAQREREQKAKAEREAASRDVDRDGDCDNDVDTQEPQSRDIHRDMSRSMSRDQGVTVERDSHRDPIRDDPRRSEEKQTHAGARVDERVSPAMLAEAWNRAGLGPMQDASGMADLRAAFNAPSCEADPYAYCAAWKRLSSAWRRGGAKGSGESPRLMVDHMDKVYLVVTGELNPDEIGPNRAPPRPADSRRGQVETSQGLDYSKRGAK